MYLESGHKGVTVAIPTQHKGAKHGAFDKSLLETVAQALLATVFASCPVWTLAVASFIASVMLTLFRRTAQVVGP